MFGYANPSRFLKLSRPLKWLAGLTALVLMPAGLYLALIASPPDYQQSETVRIMYVHVPSAWLSLAVYASMSVAAFVLIVGRHVLAGLYLRAAVSAGAGFTAICLITGALWGKPMWGTWWVWDARLTSVLILFFIYLGIMALLEAFDDPEKGDLAGAWLTLVGSVNLPVIKFSVDWWNTLHQPASIKTGGIAIHPEMLAPLLTMAGGMTGLAALLILLGMENKIAARRLETGGERRRDG